MPYGQLVIGPPGSGKTTFCHAMQQWFEVTKSRMPILVNLDPANDELPYKCSLDIRELITVEQVMKEKKLGPNGALMDCLHTLEGNMGWLEERLLTLGADPNSYFIFDAPGQAELFTHEEVLTRIVEHLQKLDMRLVTVNLVDCFCCLEPARYISAVLLSLNAMIRIELPHVNVLSKFDLIKAEGVKEQLAYPLEFYTSVLDLHHLSDYLRAQAGHHSVWQSKEMEERIQVPSEKDDEEDKGDEVFSTRRDRFHKLNESLCDLIDDYSMVHFEPVSVEDKESLYRLCQILDRANGFVFGGLEMGNESIMETAVSFGLLPHAELDFDMQEDPS